MPTGSGVVINYAVGNTIGGTTAAARNVISGNLNGVYIAGGSANVVEGDYIGTDTTGTVAIGNGPDPAGIGVGLDNTTNDTVGGTTAGARNVISGNVDNGIPIFNASSADNVIEGNFIGTDVTGTVAIRNGSGVQDVDIGRREYDRRRDLDARHRGG